MVHFSVSSMFFHEYPIAEIFDMVFESGLDSIEFWFETPAFWLAGMPAEDLRSCIGDHPGLTHLTSHTPILDLNVTSINPKVARISTEYALLTLELAEASGIAVHTVHPGRRTAKRPPSAADYERFEHFIDLLREASRGKRVKIAMENMEVKVNSLLCNPDDARELLDREPWLYFTLDVSHAMGKSVGEVHRYIELCHDRLVNVHLARAEGERMHLPLNRRPEMAGILRALDESGFSGNLTLEIEDRNFPHDLSSEEKVLVLMQELEFMKECVG
jgi:sugar phosphate isomerase/epimerase